MIQLYEEIFKDRHCFVGRIVIIKKLSHSSTLGGALLAHNAPNEAPPECLEVNYQLLKSTRDDGTSGEMECSSCSHERPNLVDFSYERSGNGLGRFTEVGLHEEGR